MENDEASPGRKPVEVVPKRGTMIDREIFLRAAEWALLESESLISQDLAQIRQAVRIAQRRSQLLLALHEISDPKPTLTTESEPINAIAAWGMLTEKQSELTSTIRQKIHTARVWLEEAGREPWDGPRNDLDNLLSRLALVAEFIPESQSAASIDIYRAFIMTLTQTDKLLVGRILSILDSGGPLDTDAVLNRIPNRSATRIKTLLSQLRKIDIIDSGPNGYFRKRASEDQGRTK
jgi:hypothetical protein